MKPCPRCLRARQTPADATDPWCVITVAEARAALARLGAHMVGMVADAWVGLRAGQTVQLPADVCAACLRTEAP